MKLNRNTAWNLLTGSEKKDRHKDKGGGTLSGTRTLELVLSFIRMAFFEYWKTHDNWKNLFEKIDPPRSRKPIERDILEIWEINKLFELGVINDPLDRALAAAIFWGGLRRSEIYGLKPEDLNWNTPSITVRNAWKRYDSKERVLEDPKCHKIRKISFPIKLQEAIRKLWAAYGQHEIVFCDASGKLPGANYMWRWLPRWIEAAGIELDGRVIIPHCGRHSIGTALEESGASRRHIQNYLGHSTWDTTRGYLHDKADHINKMGQRIDDMAEKPHEGLKIVKKTG